MHCQCKKIYTDNQSKIIVGMAFKVTTVKINEL